MSASSLYQTAPVGDRARRGGDARHADLLPGGRRHRLAPVRTSHGQFVELSVFGVGEAPFCLAQSPTRSEFIEVTIRRTGAVTNRLHTYRPGDVVGLRGPFGNAFPFERARGKHLIFVGGGIGLPPLRSLINYVLDRRADYGDVSCPVRRPHAGRSRLQGGTGRVEPVAGAHPGRDGRSRGRHVDRPRGGGHEAAEGNDGRSGRHARVHVRPAGDAEVRDGGAHRARPSGLEHRHHARTLHEVRRRQVRPLLRRTPLHLRGRPGLQLRPDHQRLPEAP